MAQTIALFPALRLVEPPMSLRIARFSMEHLVPISGESLFGPLPTLSIAIPPRFLSFLFHLNIPIQSPGKISLLGLSANSSRCCFPFVLPLFSRAASKVGFLFRKNAFTPTNLLSYKSSIRQTLEYFIHVQEAASSIARSPFDWVQHKAVRLINDPSLTPNL